MKKAFTLAEVLIVLAVLGIIAVLTVPNLIKYHTRIQTQTKIAKFFSTIETTVRTAEAQEGIGFASFDTSSAGVFYDNYFEPYLNISKNCRKTACPYPCYYQKGYAAGNFSPNYCLKDGVCFQMIGINSGGYGDVLLQFDINGAKGPNRFGKDIFWLNIFKDKNTGSYDIGTPGFDYGGRAQSNLDGAIRLCKNEISSGHGGRYCTSWIVKNGFKIPKGYPWL